MFSLGKHTNKYAPCMEMCIEYVEWGALGCSGGRADEEIFRSRDERCFGWKSEPSIYYALPTLQ